MALFARSAVLTRRAQALERSLAAALASSRGYASDSSVQLPEGLLEATNGPVGTGADVVSAAAAAAPELADATSVAAAAASTADLSGILGVTIGAIDAMHVATGLPWWATIAGVGVLVRTAMLPIALKGMAASGALVPLLREARQQVAAELAASSPAVAAEGHQRQQQQAAATAAPAAQQQQRKASKKGRKEEAIVEPPPLPPLPPPPSAPSTAAILARFHALRTAAGAPHPMWVLASPLAQLPVFITSMASIRTMSLTGWPGFATGGVAWFPDLTLPAMDLASLQAPMGAIGAALPVAIVVSMFANIQAGFASPTSRPGAPQEPNVMLYVMDKLKLLLEWLMVPLFGVALQLPHGTLVYWATSSTYALVQNKLLRVPEIRELVGLSPRRPPPRPAVSDAEMVSAPASATAAAAAGAGGTAAPASTAEALADAERLRQQLKTFLATTTDINALFTRAAELRAEGRVRGAMLVLQRLLELHPRQPRALYALGQLHAAVKEWAASEQMYLSAAEQEADAHQRARCWFGAAVALHQEGELETALDAFHKAADSAQSDDLRVRSWVAQATLHRKLGQQDVAIELLQRAAKIEPKIEEIYIKPLLRGEEPGAAAAPTSAAASMSQAVGKQDAEEPAAAVAKDGKKEE